VKWLWGLGGAIVLGLAAAIFMRRPPVRQIKKELDAIEDERETKRREITLGKDHALAKVEETHQATLQKLDGRQKERADALRSDPAKLARMLNRLSD